MALVRSVSGIRGIVGKDIYPNTITNIAEAFADFIGSGTIVCGRDTRKSGNIFKNIFCNTLNFKGINVIDIGIVPTPTVLYIVNKLNYQGGFIITASHNPPEYNGIKLVSKSGKFLNKQEYEIFSEFEKNRKVYVNGFGNTKYNSDMYKLHIEEILKNKLIELNLIKKSKLKVVFDGGNGGGAIVITELLKQLNVQLITINTNTDGIFNRNPEPIPANLKELEQAVKKYNADIGFATDGDGDRIAIVTPQKGAVSEEYTIALTIHYVLKKTNKRIGVINKSTSRMLEIMGEKHNYSILRAPVGEANVVDLLIKKNVIIGGEGNGGVIVPSINKTRDALIAVSLLLSMIAEYKKNIDDIIEEFPELYMKKIKIPLKNNINLTNIVKQFDNSQIDYEDGLRIEMKNGFLHIRKSGTEPIIRIIGEFDNKMELDNNILKLKELICAE